MSMETCTEHDDVVVTYDRRASVGAFNWDMRNLSTSPPSK